MKTRRRRAALQTGALSPMALEALRTVARGSCAWRTRYEVEFTAISTTVVASNVVCAAYPTTASYEMGDEVCRFEHLEDQGQ